MAVPILTTAASVTCPHGGTVTLFTSQSAVTAGGGALCLETDQHTVAGCPFVVGTKPQPCVLVRWSAAASRTRINGIGVLLSTSVGQCFSAEQILQGVAIVVATQQQAKGA
jgi:hypothetical protein